MGINNTDVPRRLILNSLPQSAATSLQLKMYSTAPFSIFLLRIISGLKLPQQNYGLALMVVLSRTLNVILFVQQICGWQQHNALCYASNCPMFNVFPWHLDWSRRISAFYFVFFTVSENWKHLELVFHWPYLQLATARLCIHKGHPFEAI